MAWLDSHLDWQGTDTPPALATTLAVVVAVATYVSTRRRDNKIKRAEMVQKFADQLANNDVLFGQFCLIDSNQFKFEDSDQWILEHADWLHSDDERSLLRLLDHFNSVAHNIERNVLRVQDLRGTTLWYAMQRAFYDPGIQAYLSWVDRFDENNGGTGDAFRYFRSLAGDFESSVRWSRRNPAPEPNEMGASSENQTGPTISQ